MGKFSMVSNIHADENNDSQMGSSTQDTIIIPAQQNALKFHWGQPTGAIFCCEVAQCQSIAW
jgi:hypothetical protein